MSSFENNMWRVEKEKDYYVISCAYNLVSLVVGEKQFPKIKESILNEASEIAGIIKIKEDVNDLRIVNTSMILNDQCIMTLKTLLRNLKGEQNETSQSAN